MSPNPLDEETGACLNGSRLGDQLTVRQPVERDVGPDPFGETRGARWKYRPLLPLQDLPVAEFS